MKLTCKLCGYQAMNLVPHIETEHGGENGLADYVTRHGGVNSVVHPSLQAGATEQPTTMPEPTTEPRAVAMARAETAKPEATIEIAGVRMAKVTGLSDRLKSMVPEVNDAYHFADWSARALSCINRRLPTGYVGHTGTGKTSFIMQVAARIGQPVLRVNLNQQTTISDFVGTWGVRGGETVWIDGALPRALREGIWLIADEVDYGEPAILSVLNPVMERKPALMLKEKDGEVITAHPNFRIFVTGNTLGQYSEWRHLYQGANLLNEAWLDRIHLFVVSYLSEVAEAEVLTKAIPLMTAKIAKELVKVAALARQAFVKEELTSPFSTRRLQDWAEELMELRALKAEAPFKAAETTIFSKVPREDKVAIEGFMKRILLDKNDAK